MQLNILFISFYNSASGETKPHTCSAAGPLN